MTDMTSPNFISRVVEAPVSRPLRAWYRPHASHAARTTLDTCPRDRSPRPWASAAPSRNGRHSTKLPACAVKVRARDDDHDARERDARASPRILFF